MINISGFEYTKEELETLEKKRIIVLGLTKERKAEKLTRFIRHYKKSFTHMEQEQTWNFILNHLTKMGFDYSEILTDYMRLN